MSARSFDINKVNKKQANIQVSNLDNVLKVFLHNHCVLKKQGDIVQVSSCGYLTPTTKVAINRALSQLNMPYNVYQKKGQWYVLNHKTSVITEFKDDMIINRDLLNNITVL